MKLQTDQTYLQKILLEDFSQRKVKNPSFSVRAYSKKLKISHSALSEILGGKRQVGLKVAERIADILMLDPQERARLLTAKPEKISRAREALQLKADRYAVIADWYHFAILSLLEVDDFQSSVEWIAKRLGIHKAQAQTAIERLERLEMIHISEKGEMQATGISFSSSDEIPSAAVRQTHHQYLELAKESLDRDSIQQRDFNAMTMAIDPAKLPEAKQRLRKFRDDLCAFLESGEKKEIYQLCLQLFPLSKEVLK